MIAYIDEQARHNCWNLHDSYGEICVHCGCCEKDKAKRYKARLKTVKGWIWQKENWYKPDDSWEEYQIKNRRDSIRQLKRIQRYYEQKVKELSE